MSSLSYNEIFSRFLSKVEGYDLFDEGMNLESRYALLCSWLHSAVSKSQTSRLFSSVYFSDTYVDVEAMAEENYDVESVVTDGSFDYELKDSLDSNLSNIDDEFVLELLAYGMVLAWLEPKVNSLTNIAQFFGTSDEKFYSQAAHLAELRGLRDDAVSAQYRLITERGFAHNSYLKGTGPSASLRS